MLGRCEYFASAAECAGSAVSNASHRFSPRTTQANMRNKQKTVFLIVNLLISVRSLQVSDEADYASWDPEDYEMTPQEQDKARSLAGQLFPAGDQEHAERIVAMYLAVHYDAPTLARRAAKAVAFLRPLARRVKRLGARAAYEQLRSYHQLALRAAQELAFCTPAPLDKPLLSRLEDVFADPAAAKAYLAHGPCNATSTALACLVELGVLEDTHTHTNSSSSWCGDLGPLYADARTSLQLGLSGLSLENVRADNLVDSYRRVRHHLTDQLARHAHRLIRRARQSARTHGEYTRLWLSHTAAASPRGQLGRDALALLPHFGEAAREAGDIRYFGAVWLPSVLGVYVDVLRKGYLEHMVPELPFALPQQELQKLSDKLSLDQEALDELLRLAYSRLYYEPDDEAKHSKFLDTLQHHADFFGLQPNVTFQKLVWFDAFHTVLVSTLPSMLRFDVAVEGHEVSRQLRFFLGRFPFFFYPRYRSFDLRTFPGSFAYSAQDLGGFSLEWMVAALESFAGDQEGVVDPRESEAAAQLLELVDEELGDPHLQAVAAQRIGGLLERMVVLEKALDDSPVWGSADAAVNHSLNTFLSFLYLDGPYFGLQLPDAKRYASESRRAYLIDCLEDLLEDHVLPKSVRLSILNLLPLFTSDSEQQDIPVGCDI